MSDRSDSQRAAFDDDRLLDYALGLDDDPELAAALSHSARLRERLADLKSDLAAIETELRRGFPPIDESYTDLSSSRWSRLRHSLGEPEAVRRRPLRGRRLTAVLVAAALALALVIGLATILTRNPGSNATSGVAANGASKNAVRAPASSLAGGAAVPAAGAAGVTAAQAAAYRDVAVVRVGPLRGASQGFTVVRTPQGHPAGVVLARPAGDQQRGTGRLAGRGLPAAADHGGSCRRRSCQRDVLVRLAAGPRGRPAGRGVGLGRALAVGAVRERRPCACAQARGRGRATSLPTPLAGAPRPRQCISRPCRDFSQARTCWSWASPTSAASPGRWPVRCIAQGGRLALTYQSQRMQPRVERC